MSLDALMLFVALSRFKTYNIFGKYGYFKQVICGLEIIGKI